ncbi:MAG: AMP-binding protein [Desulfobacterales bacterium]|nr:AMP-binding protein [Desulfobacterales bacterium]
MGVPSIYTKEMIAEYTRKGYWDSVTITDTWDQTAAAFPDKEAIVDVKTRLTWAQTKQWIDRFALALLELGLKKDEVMVIQLPNWAELILTQVACEKAGVICIAVPPALRHSEIEYIVRTVAAAGIIIPLEFHNFNYFKMVEAIRPGLPTLKHVLVAADAVPPHALSVKKMFQTPAKAEDPDAILKNTRFSAFEFARIQLTAGSTGFPKFIEAPICGRMHCARMWSQACRLGPEDVCGVFAVGPGGPNFVGIAGTPLVGAKMVLLESFDAAKALALIEKEQVTCVGLVPTMLAKIIEHPDFDHFDLSRLRVMMITGAPLPAPLAEAADRKKLPIVNMYGSMDFGGITMPDITSPRHTRLFTANKPIPSLQLKMVDETGAVIPGEDVGHILVKGPTSTSGFYKDPETSRQTWTEDGWFPTGDLGKIDENGNLVIAGRQKDVIIRGGQNIYPAEIENLLLEHPKIAAVAIVPMPDEVMGERACAYVVLRNGQQMDFEEMVNFLKQKHIATYKLPERIEITDAIPLVPGVGKVDKKVLARRIADQVKGETAAFSTVNR